MAESRKCLIYGLVKKSGYVLAALLSEFNPGQLGASKLEYVAQITRHQLTTWGFGDTESANFPHKELASRIAAMPRRLFFRAPDRAMTMASADRVLNRILKATSKFWRCEKGANAARARSLQKACRQEAACLHCIFRAVTTSEASNGELLSNFIVNGNADALVNLPFNQLSMASDLNG
jgi:hypothetical protein